MHELLISRTIDIHRPAAVVHRQFGDVAHHQHQRVHRGVHFEVLHDDGTTCRYRQTTAVGPLRSVQHLQLDRMADGTLVNTITSGQFARGTITFTVESVDSETTRVTASFRAALGVKGLVARPVLRRVVTRSLEAALAEDRDDLESERFQ